MSDQPELLNMRDRPELLNKNDQAELSIPTLNKIKK